MLCQHYIEIPLLAVCFWTFNRSWQIMDRGLSFSFRLDLRLESGRNKTDFFHQITLIPEFWLFVILWLNSEFSMAPILCTPSIHPKLIWYFSASDLRWLRRWHLGFNSYLGHWCWSLSQLLLGKSGERADCQTVTGPLPYLNLINNFFLIHVLLFDSSLFWRISAHDLSPSGSI